MPQKGFEPFTSMVVSLSINHSTTISFNEKLCHSKKYKPHLEFYMDYS
jgi:hypothetical protein